MLNILVLKFENKLFSGEVTVGFYELNNSREILDVPNNTILRKKRIGRILTTSIKHLETFHLMRGLAWAWISILNWSSKTKIENKFQVEDPFYSVRRQFLVTSSKQIWSWSNIFHEYFHYIYTNLSYILYVGQKHWT